MDAWGLTITENSRQGLGTKWDPACLKKEKEKKKERPIVFSCHSVNNNQSKYLHRWYT